MNIKAYLERINYHGLLAPTAETLRDLQVAHLLAVPFENLSIHARQPIILEDEALFTKIVERRRGGFCYEANGLFAALLRALGFDVAMLSAEVARADGGFGPDFDHMALMVTLEERWLVDVGFGDSFLEPLRLDERGEQVQGGRAYRILPDGPYLVLMRGAMVESGRLSIVLPCSRMSTPIMQRCAATTRLPRSRISRKPASVRGRQREGALHSARCVLSQPLRTARGKSEP